MKRELISLYHLVASHTNAITEKERLQAKSYLKECLQTFRCKRDPDIENFLSQDAIRLEEQHLCRTYLMVDSDMLRREQLKVLGFFTIGLTTAPIPESMSGLSMPDEGESADSRGTIEVPAYQILQVARNDDCARSDCPGFELLEAAERIIYQACDLMGGNLIFLDCQPVVKLLECYMKLGYALLDVNPGDAPRFLKMIKRI